MELRFPFATIDFEASGLGSASYPIEVGVAIVRAPAAGVESWSTLISPHVTWRESGSWDRKSQAVHGVTPDMLAQGMEPAAALARLADLLAEMETVWCDGGEFDLFWFERLCKAAPLIRPGFQLCDIAALFARDRHAHNRFADAIAATEPPHRAGPDAVRLAGALMTACLEGVQS